MTAPKHRFLAITLLYPLFAFVVTFANAATTRVPADKPTIQAAIDSAATGDTILVAPGTYHENLVIDTKEITLASEQGASKTILDGDNNSTVLTIRNTPSLATTINGFTFQGGNNADQIIAGGIYLSKGGATITHSVFGANYGGQIFIEKGSAVVSSNSLTTSPFPSCGINNGNGGFAIKIWNLSTVIDSKGNVVPNDILDNLIEGTSSCPGIAITVTTTSAGNADIPGPVNIANNIIRNNEYAIGVYSTQALVQQNVIYGNFAGALTLIHPVSTSPTTNPTDFTDPPDYFVVNNTIANNAWKVSGGSIKSVSLSGNYAKIAFINNLVLSSSSVPIFECYPSHYTPVIFDHNDIYNSNGPIFDGNCLANATGNGNISAPAQFVSATDLHLNPGSPAIDAGNNSSPSLTTTDINGAPRIQDGTGNGLNAVDMGAYETSGVQNATPSVLTLTSSEYYTYPGVITLTARLLTSNSPARPVSFYQDGTLLSSAVLDPSSLVSTNLTLSKPGLYSFTAKLDAASGFSPATSVVIYVYVAAGQLTSSTSLTATPNPVDVDQPLTLSSVVTGSGTSAAPTGIVTFYDGNTPLGPATLDAAGHATYTTPTLGAGIHTLRSVYGGDTTYSQSSSPAVSETVRLLPSTTTFTIAPGAVVAVQPVTVTVNVDPITKAPYSSQFCSCAVTVSIVGLPSGVAPTYTLPLHNGSATFSFGVGFGTGAYTFSAKFNGSTVFASSSSAPVQLNVARAPTAISLTASPNPATQNRTISLSANITALLSATVGPGSITFFDGTTLIASAPFGSAGPIPANQLTNTATVTVNSSALAAGTHSITASYAGNNNFLPAVSSPLVVTIKPQDFSIVAADPAITIQTEHHRATRVTLTSVGAFADQLSLRCDNLPAHATCTFDHSALQVLPNGTATANLIIDTDDVLGFKADNSRHNWTQGISFTALLLPAGLLAVSRRRRLFPRLLLLLLATLAVTLPLTGCDGLYPRSTAPGTYTISVIANGVATKLTRSALITLTITK